MRQGYIDFAKLHGHLDAGPDPDPIGARAAMIERNHTAWRKRPTPGASAPGNVRLDRADAANADPEAARAAMIERHHQAWRAGRDAPSAAASPPSAPDRDEDRALPPPGELRLDGAGRRELRFGIDEEYV